MANQPELAKQFVAALSSGGSDGANPAASLLADDAAFMAQNGNLSGREAVLERLTGAETGKLYRDATWSEPSDHRGAVQVTGRLPAGSPQGGLHLVLGFNGDKISTIKQQAIPAAPGPSTDLKLSPELKELVNNSLASRHPMLVAVVNEAGQPLLSYRGSLHVHGDTQLAFWARNTEGNLGKSLQKNPRVTVFYRDAEARILLQFQGRASIPHDEATIQKVYDESPEPERLADVAQLGMGVIIDLDRIDGIASVVPGGRVSMQRAG